MKTIVSAQYTRAAIRNAVTGSNSLRPKRWDERLPFPGTGRAEWRGLLPRSQTPQVINPARGWLTNWNNVPSAGWTQPTVIPTEPAFGQSRVIQSLSRFFNSGSLPRVACTQLIESSTVTNCSPVAWMSRSLRPN